ncbi:MAG: TlpA disulfide reductase family protein [Planctomycetota bacterium]|nr:TlpA disulfide reductase family protein [Planctomycetota bacterium]
MYPHERSLVKQLSEKPFALIGVNSDSELDEIRSIVKEKNITWRSFWNGPDGTSGPISTQWNVSGWPTIYVMDAEGKIRYKNVRGAKMDEAITTLLAEMGHEVEIVHEDHAEEE